MPASKGYRLLRAPRRAPRRAWAVALLTAATVTAALLGTRGADAASYSVQVSATYLSQTALTGGGCLPAAIDLGLVLPGENVTTADCTVTFGSNNDTSTLRLGQTDGTGSAMYSITDGRADTTWSATGARAYDLGGAGDGDTPHLGGLVVQPDGMVLLAGRASGNKMGLVRVKTDGTLDTTTPFATAGVYTNVFATNSTAVALQADNKILLAGVRATSGNDFALVRMTASGGTDATFPNFSWNSAATQDDRPFAIMVRPTGEILLAGSSHQGIAVLQLTPGGTLDPNYGVGGVAYVPMGGTALTGDAALAPDGSVYAVTHINPDSVKYTHIMRGGQLDTSWGTSGITTFNTGGGSNPQIHKLLLQTDGKLISGGAIYASQGLVIRLLADGTGDPGFGASGQRTYSIPGHSNYLDSGIVQLPDGSYYIAGDGDMGAGTFGYLLLHLNADGSRDLTFNSGVGYRFVAAPSATAESAHGGLAMVDGKLYQGGGNGDLHLIRYGSDERAIPDYATPSNDWDDATSMFGACLRAHTNSTPVWTEDATCPKTNGLYWQGVPKRFSDSTARVAQAANGVLNATATVRFGLHAGIAQKPAPYYAPVTFDVIAPAV